MNNIDGFNERMNYIRNANDQNRLNSSPKVNHDSTFAEMKVKENTPDIKTVSQENTNYIEEPKGLKENFVIRNYNIDHFNQKNTPNRVSQQINRRLFKNN